MSVAVLVLMVPGNVPRTLVGGHQWERVGSREQHVEGDD